MNLRDEPPGRLPGDRSAHRAHPDSETLVRAAEGALHADEREAVAAHLETCALCAGDVRVAFDALGAPSLPERRGIPGAWLAVAAVAVLAAGAAVLFTRSPGHPTSGERGVPSALHRTVPANGAAVETATSELAWEDAPAAEEYTLLLYDAESRLLWTSPSSKSPRATLPPDVRSLFPARPVPGGSSIGVREPGLSSGSCLPRDDRVRRRRRPRGAAGASLRRSRIPVSPRGRAAPEGETHVYEAVLARGFVSFTVNQRGVGVLVTPRAGLTRPREHADHQRFRPGGRLLAAAAGPYRVEIRAQEKTPSRAVRAEWTNGDPRGGRAACGAQGAYRRAASSTNNEGPARGS